MTPEQIATAIEAVQLAIANNAMVDGIVGHGPSRDNRSIDLGLTSEQSQPVLAALLGALQSLQG